MARDLCIEFPNAFYHVFSRGINRQRLFYDNEDRAVFLNLCRKAVRKYQITIMAFCLMDNHYHLYLSTPQANIATAMKFINQSYAIFFLAKYPDKDGHVFKGRYKRKIVQTDKYSMVLINYIHSNPVVANICSTHSAYPWSSYASYVGVSKRLDFIDYDWGLGQFGKAENGLVNFIQFHQEQSNSTWNPGDEAKAQSFLAEDSFIKSICDEYVDFSLLEGKSIAGLKELKAICNREAVMQLVTSLGYDLETNVKIAVFLLKEYTTSTFKEIATLINKSEEATSKCFQRFRKQLSGDPKLELEISKLVEMSDVRIRP